MKIELDTEEKIIYLKVNEPVSISEINRFVNTSFPNDYDEYKIALKPNESFTVPVADKPIYPDSSGKNPLDPPWSTTSVANKTSEFSFKPSGLKNNKNIEHFVPDQGPNFDELKVDEGR